MARARNLKPGFFRNADLVELPVEARLLFAGLWTIADREGRMEDRPKQIKMEIFPADSFDVDSMLSMLEQSGFIERYEVNGNKYLQVVNFGKHQNPHRDEKASSIPAPCKHCASTVQAPCDIDANRADSLNPITDSLVSVTNVTEGDNKLPPCPHEEIISAYHEALPELPTVREWNKTRQGYMRSRWKDHPSLDYWRKYFSYVAESSFLTGRAEGRGGAPPFIADLEWLIRPTNFAKVIEGKYHRSE